MEEHYQKKSRGEIGIENLKNQSKAAKVKLQWRYSQESQTLKCWVIKTKYEELDNWVSKEVTTFYGVSLWRCIRSYWPFLRSQSNIKVDNGNQTLFLGRQVDGSCQVRSSIPWHLCFRPTSTQDSWMAGKFQDRLTYIKAFGNFSWNTNWSGLFMVEWRWQKYIMKVKVGYKNWNQAKPQITNWPWEHIWKIKVPHKVACFTWLIPNEAVLTHDNLSKRRISQCSNGFFNGKGSKLPFNYLK